MLVVETTMETTEIMMIVVVENELPTGEGDSREYLCVRCGGGRPRSGKTRFADHSRRREHMHH